MKKTLYTLYIRKRSKLWQCRFRHNKMDIRKSCGTTIESTAHQTAQLWIRHYQRLGTPPPNTKTTPNQTSFTAVNSQSEIQHHANIY